MLKLYIFLITEAPQSQGQVSFCHVEYRMKLNTAFFISFFSASVQLRGVTSHVLPVNIIGYFFSNHQSHFCQICQILCLNSSIHYIIHPSILEPVDHLQVMLRSEQLF